jgi:colicin import membrane protein
MGSYIRNHTGAVGLSAGLHIAIAVALTLGISFSDPPLYPPAGESVAIEATVVDEALIRREMERLEQQEQAEILHQQEQERLAREQAEAARQELEEEQARVEAVRQERERTVRLEEQRLADLQLQRDEAERVQAEDAARLVREREAEAQRQREEVERQREEAERQRLAEEQRQREEQQRLAREAEAARQRAESEAELQRVMAQEDERRRAEESGLLDQYIRLIVNRIEQNWIRPASAQPGLECEVRVIQIPSGDIVDARVGRCNGDDAVIRSIEAAVLKSSPLPRPPLPSLFERTLNVVFTPDV